MEGRNTLSNNKHARLKKVEKWWIKWRAVRRQGFSFAFIDRYGIIILAR